MDGSGPHRLDHWPLPAALKELLHESVVWMVHGRKWMIATVSAVKRVCGPKRIQDPMFVCPVTGDSVHVSVQKTVIGSPQIIVHADVLKMVMRQR